MALLSNHNRGPKFIEQLTLIPLGSMFNYVNMVLREINIKFISLNADGTYKNITEECPVCFDWFEMD